MIFSAGVHIIHASYPHHLSNFMAHDVIQSCFHIHRKYYILTDIYTYCKSIKFSLLELRELELERERELENMKPTFVFAPIFVKKVSKVW